jgi:hypothetical protein
MSLSAFCLINVKMDNMQKRNLEKNMAATVFNQAQFDVPPL